MSCSARLLLLPGQRIVDATVTSRDHALAAFPKSNIGSVGDTLLATIGADVAESSAEAGLEMRIKAEVVAATCCSL